MIDVRNQREFSAEPLSFTWHSKTPFFSGQLCWPEKNHIPMSKPQVEGPGNVYLHRLIGRFKLTKLGYRFP
jgi:hypothetical protein